MHSTYQDCWKEIELLSELLSNPPQACAWAVNLGVKASQPRRGETIAENFFNILGASTRFYL
jgi:hypothetical protein